MKKKESEEEAKPKRHHFGYTGWQQRISKALHKTFSIPGLDEALNKMNELLHYKHNHWIATCYEDGHDNISLHSDKVQNWVPGSCFIILKMGAPRRFQFSQSVHQVDANGEFKYDKKGKPVMKDVVIFDEIIQPGTAIIVDKRRALELTGFGPTLG